MPDKSTIKKLWEMRDLSDSSEIKLAAQVVRQWLIRRTDDPIAQFLAGESDLNIESPDAPITDQLEVDICREFHKNSKEHIHLTAFAVVLNQGIKSGIFNLCPPRIPILYTPPKSPFQPDQFHYLTDIRRWRKYLHETLITSPEEDMEAFIGQILLSAIINGGVLHHSTLKILFTVLHEPLELLQIREHPGESFPLVFFDLPLPRPDGATPEMRRWFPDYFTETLIYRLPHNKLQKLHKKLNHSKQLANKLKKCVERFFTYAGATKDESPSNIKVLMTATLFEMRTKLPMFVCEYAAGKIVSHSLRHDVLKRFYGLTIQGDESEEENKEFKAAEIEESLTGHKAINSAKTEPLDESRTVFEANWLQTLRRVFSNNKTMPKDPRTYAKQKLEIMYETVSKEPFSSAAIFIGWAQFMLTGNKIAFSVIREYTGHIANRIIGHLGNEDITTLEGEGLGELYHQILDDIESYDSRRKVARGLREFHRYLVDKFHMAPINAREVLGIAPLHSKVDANIITIDEYYAIHHQIDQQNLEIIHPEFRIITKLIFTLAFRCGLRRLEVLKLLVDDFHDSRHPVLLIRNNFARRLKTENAVRKLPLDTLLEDDELDILRKFHQTRKGIATKSSPFLFSIPFLAYEIVPEQKIFTIIRDTMRQVTGDATLTLYNLRHSFASWTILRLVLADQGITEDIFPHLPATTRYLRQSSNFREVLFRGIACGRRSLYALSVLMGHASPQTTMEHYLHFMGLITRILLRASEHLHRPALINNSNQARSSAQRWYKNGDINGFISKLREKQKPQCLRCNKTAIFPVYLCQPEACPFVNKIRNIWTYLFLISAREGINRDMLRDRLQHSHEETDNFEQVSTRVRQQKPRSQTGHRHRHRLKMSLRQEEQLSANKSEYMRIFCPLWPRTKQEKDILYKYAPKVWHLYETEREFMLDILVLFVKNSWYTINEVIFHDFDEAYAAQNYLLFLEKIGINKRSLRFICFDPSHRSRYRTIWKDLLGLTWRHHIEKRPDKNEKSIATKKWLGIAPVFSSQKSKQENTSSGFRFLMIMTAIHANYKGYQRKK